jgi:hypothetical protein
MVLERSIAQVNSIRGRKPAQLYCDVGRSWTLDCLVHEPACQSADFILLQRVNAPIVLDLGGPTPKEIAVAILAEVIAVRRGGKFGSRSRRPSRTFCDICP